MPDEYTTAAVFGNATVFPVTPSTPDQWSDPIGADTVQGLAARMATGQLTESDDWARVNGTLGGTADDVTLHREFVATSGGPEPSVAVTNPTKPMVAADVANAPAPVSTKKGA